jgi:hypothetical protein
MSWMQQAYLLVRQHIATNLPLILLHDLDVGFHAFFGKRTSEEVADVGI